MRSLYFLAPENVSETISSEQVDHLAKELGPEWTKLALELNYGDDEIEYIKSSEPEASPRVQAKRLLDLFMVILTKFITYTVVSDGF